MLFVQLPLPHLEFEAVLGGYDVTWFGVMTISKATVISALEN